MKPHLFGFGAAVDAVLTTVASDVSMRLKTHTRATLYCAKFKHDLVPVVVRGDVRKRERRFFKTENLKKWDY